MTRWRSAVATIGVLAVAACAAPSSAPPVAPSPRPTIALGKQQQPRDLVGLWRVVATGEEAGAILRLGSDLSIWRRCADVFGGWRADTAGGFLGDTYVSSNECAGAIASGDPRLHVPGAAAAPGWLLRATAYRVDGAGRLLLDEHGGTVARLIPSGEPSPRHVVGHKRYAKPVLDAALQQALAPAAALPAKLRPATADELVGTWKSTDAGANPRQFVTLMADRSWRGSDGCNGQRGRWTANGPGALLAVSGFSTVIGCSGQDKAVQFALARGAGFDGTTLVLTDAGGKVIGRLRH